MSYQEKKKDYVINMLTMSDQMVPSILFSAIHLHMHFAR